MGPFSDRLAQLVSGERDPSAPLPTYVTSSTAIAANGLLSRALANGGDRRGATRIGGVPTMFLVDTTGPHGGCRWTTEFADIGELERAESALMADASWVALIDRVGSSSRARDSGTSGPGPGSAGAVFPLVVSASSRAARPHLRHPDGHPAGRCVGRHACRRDVSVQRLESGALHQAHDRNLDLEPGEPEPDAAPVAATERHRGERRGFDVAGFIGQPTLGTKAEGSGHRTDSRCVT
jgi:hypothetical protein